MNQPKANEIYFTHRTKWKAWLERNHDRVPEIWIIYYKKISGKSGISYDDSVEEAICFGWIDSIVRKIDEEKFCRKFTPRKKNSRWSELNKKRADKMVKLGLMRKSGLDKIAEAKKSGKWYNVQDAKMEYPIPDELEKELESQAIARFNFKKMAPSSRKQMIGWIASAKKPETRLKRVKEVVGILKKNQKLGLK